MAHPHIGVEIDRECIDTWKQFQVSRDSRFIIFKLNDTFDKIVVEETSKDSNWETFRSKLLNAKSSWKGREGRGPRLAVYDFQYELEEGMGIRSKYLFVYWSPDDSLLWPRMNYASSKNALKDALDDRNNLFKPDANQEDELAHDHVLEEVRKRRR